MLELDGQRLSLARIAAVASGHESVFLSNSARQRVEKSRLIVEKIVAEGRTVYGVNTGFGRLSDVHIDSTELVQSGVDNFRDVRDHVEVEFDFDRLPPAVADGGRRLGEAARKRTRIRSLKCEGVFKTLARLGRPGTQHDIEAALRQRERAGLSDASTGARDDRHFVRACHFPRAPLVRSLVRYPSVRKWAKGARGRAPRQREDT